MGEQVSQQELQAWWAKGEAMIDGMEAEAGDLVERAKMLRATARRMRAVLRGPRRRRRRRGGGGEEAGDGG